MAKRTKIVGPTFSESRFVIGLSATTLLVFFAWTIYMRYYFRYPSTLDDPLVPPYFERAEDAKPFPDARSLAVSARGSPGSLFHRQRDAGRAGAAAQLLPASGNAQLASLLQKSGSHELCNLRGRSAAGRAIDSSRQDGAGNSGGDCAAIRGCIDANGEMNMEMGMGTAAYDFRGATQAEPSLAGCIMRASPAPYWQFSRWRSAQVSGIRMRPAPKPLARSVTSPT